MRQFLIKRISYRQDGTFGVWLDGSQLTTATDDGQPFAVSIELPWKLNIPYKSCIPSGNYIVDRIIVESGVVFKVRDVSGRTGIDIHTANIVKNLKGCIGVGEEFDVLNDLTMIKSSTKGFNELVERTSGLTRFTLLIVGNKIQERQAIINTIDRRQLGNLPGVVELSWTTKLTLFAVKAYKAVVRAKQLVTPYESKWKKTAKGLLFVLEALLRITAYFGSKGILSKLL